MATIQPIIIEIPRIAQVLKRLADMHKFKGDRAGGLKRYSRAEQEYIQADCYYKLAMHFMRFK